MTNKTLFALLICFASCINIDDSNQVTTVALFDIEQFLELEHSKHNPQDIQKEISYNGQVESSKISNYDLTEDFEVLKSVNINNPSWSDKYQIDTLSADKSNLIIKYTAIDDKLPIKSMETTTVDGVAIAFKAISERKALVADTKKVIEYHSDHGYTISTETESVTAEKRTVTISVRYTPV